MPAATIKAAWIRFLFPFLAEAKASKGWTEPWKQADTRFLEAGKDRGEGQSALRMWSVGKAHATSAEVLFPEAQAFLYGGERLGCRHLALQQAYWQSRFGNAVEVERAGKGGTWQSLGRMTADPGCEMYFSPMGAGVLSFGFRIEVDGEGGEGGSDGQMAQVLEMCYRLAQEHKSKWATIRREKGRRPEEERVSLKELAEEWLEPLGKDYWRPMQQRMLAYSVVVFDGDVDFLEESWREKTGAFARGLSRVEELRHARTGERGGSMVVDSRHWSHVSEQGAAHLLAEQFKGAGFDPQRAHSALHRHSVPYLMALMQRGLLLRVRGDSVDSILKSPGARVRVKELRKELMELSAVAMLPVISGRESISRQYELAQEALQVERLQTPLLKSLAALEAEAAAGEQTRVLTAQKRSLREIAKLQRNTEFVEVLLLVVYAVELANAFNEGLHGRMSWWVSLAYLGGAALLTYVVGVGLLLREESVGKEGKAGAERRRKHERLKRWKRGLLSVVVLAVVIIGGILSWLAHRDEGGGPGQAKAAGAALSKGAGTSRAGEGGKTHDGGQKGH